MKILATLLTATLLSINGFAQDLSLDDIVDFSISNLKTLGFSGSGNELAKDNTTVVVRKPYTGLEVITTDKGLFDDIKAEAKAAYDEVQTFHDTGVGGTVTEFVIDEAEFIMFYSRTDSITEAQSYHIGYAKD